VRSQDGLGQTVIAFCRGSRAWIQNPRSLDASLPLPSLASILVENGWLGTCADRVVSRDPIALGDVGYINKDGLFVVIANVHAHLTLTSGGVPTWKNTRSCTPGEPSQDFAVVQRYGKSCKR
jgi:hypothetical protein